MKKFILGFIAGGIICAAVTGLAVEYAVTVNPYPVKVNGVETAIQGYNINDETYFKLRDVSAAVGGFEVGFEDNAIIVNTPNKPTPEPTAQNTELNPDGTRKYTIDGLLIDYLDGNGYVNSLEVTELYNLFWIGDNYIVNKNKKQFDISIPTHSEYTYLIPVDFYENTLISVITTLTE